MGLLDGLLGGLTAGEGALLGGLGSGLLSFLGTSSVNDTNQSLASQQQAFSAQQSSTIYQRGAADLAAAGLNPILSYAKPAAVATYEVPQIHNSLHNAVTAAAQTAGAVGQVASHVTGARKNSAEAARTETLTQPEREKIIADTEVSRTTDIRLVREIEKISFEIQNLQANTALAGAQTTYSGAQTNLAGAQASLASQHVHQSVAQTDVHTAQAANIRQDTLYKVAQEAATRATIDLTHAQVPLAKAHQILAYGQAVLALAQKESAASQVTLNDAHSALTRLQAELVRPDVNVNINDPKSAEFTAAVRRVFQALPGLSILLK